MHQRKQIKTKKEEEGKAFTAAVLARGELQMGGHYHYVLYLLLDLICVHMFFQLPSFWRICQGNGNFNEKYPSADRREEFSSFVKDLFTHSNPSIVLYHRETPINDKTELPCLKKLVVNKYKS